MATPVERVAADAGFRSALAVARSWGVRPSVFFGRPVVTTYEHDGAGRLVRSAQEGWTVEDVELALALADYEADCCPGCGSALKETTDPANEERYDARVTARCHRCTALAIVTDSQQDKPHPSALLVGATLKTQGDETDDSEVPA